MKLRFAKMHGLGNDFMVIDAINQDFSPRPEVLRQWADRYHRIGFDQALVVEKPTSEEAAFRYRIYNADGGEVAHPVSEVTIAGNLLDMFDTLEAADDLEFDGAVVSPTLRVAEMTVAGG